MTALAGPQTSPQFPALESKPVTRHPPPPPRPPPPCPRGLSVASEWPSFRWLHPGLWAAGGRRGLESGLNTREPSSHKGLPAVTLRAGPETVSPVHTLGRGLQGPGLGGRFHTHCMAQPAHPVAAPLGRLPMSPPPLVLRVSHSMHPCGLKSVALGPGKQLLERNWLKASEPKSELPFLLLWS